MNNEQSEEKNNQPSAENEQILEMKEVQTNAETTGAVEASESANAADQAEAGQEANPEADIITKLEAEKAELTNDLQRTRADFENFRRQQEAKEARIAEAAKEETVKKVLPLIDDFERAVAAQPEVMAPLQKNFEKVLEKLNIKKINTEVGAAFDPELHFATSVEGDGDEEVIAETQQAGYYYGEKIIRTAFVKVTKK